MKISGLTFSFQRMFLPLLVMALIVQFDFAGGKNQISIFTGANYVLKYGSEKDYEPFANDFPVTPAHITPSFGISYTRYFSRKIGAELDIRYHHSSRITLVDPSDKDEVKINSSKHIGITGNFIYQFSGEKFRPYLLIGAGADSLVGVKNQTVESSLGYIVTIEAPEKKVDFTANAGAGVKYLISSKFGLRADLRYIVITTSPNVINSFNFVLGAFSKF